jgi:hypothetical protein
MPAPVATTRKQHRVRYHPALVKLDQEQEREQNCGRENGCGLAGRALFLQGSARPLTGVAVWQRGDDICSMAVSAVPELTPGTGHQGRTEEVVVAVDRLRSEHDPGVGEGAERPAV